MSIINLLNKIKNKTGIDKTIIMYFCIITGIALSSFGLGRLSVNNNYIKNIKGNNIIKENKFQLNVSQEERGDYELSEKILIKKMYVASKNGKLYYSIGCNGAKRIKPENEIWFSTTDEAEKSGYKFSSTCK